MPGAVLISTAEFALKSQPVRHQLARLLKRHIRFNLRRAGLEKCEIGLAGGFLVVSNLDDAENVAKMLARIPGIAHADACERTSSSLKRIVEHAAKLAERKIGRGQTFAVRARNFEPSSMKGKEIEIQAGAEIISRLPGYAKVNLSSPDHTFRVFFGADDAFISGARFDGPDGLPVGSQGSLLGLATDSAYSPLSFYMLMKRGAMVWPVIPNIRSFLGEIQPEAILEGLRMLTPFVPKKKFEAHLIELDEETSKVIDGVDQSLQRAFSIRLAYRAITHLAQTVRALGLVAADVLGLDGIETLKDLKAIDEVAKLPVYRPLLTLGEENVNRELAELGLLEFARSQPARRVGLIAVSEDALMKLRDVEERVRAEQLAERIAAKATRVSI